MLKNRFLRACLVAATLVPLVAIAAVAATATPREEPCDCDATKCERAIAECYTLICAGGENTKCPGTWKEQ